MKLQNRNSFFFIDSQKTLTMADKQQKATSKNAGTANGTNATTGTSDATGTIATTGTTGTSDAAGTTGTSDAASTTGTTAAGPKKSTSSLLPTTGEKREAGKKAVSPAALTSLKVGQSIGGISLRGVFGKPKGTGGRTSNGEKPKLLAVFGIAYADYNDLGKYICNGQTVQQFVAGAAHTRENRLMMIITKEQTVAASGVAYSNIAEEMVALGLAESTDACIINERGVWILPNGYFTLPLYDKVENKDTLSSFRKYADLAEHYTQLAANTEEGELKEHYTAMAEGFGNGEKYQGFACATLETQDGIANAQRLATRVRNWFSLNPEFNRSDIFQELPQWEAVFGQRDVASIPNNAWAETEEGIAEAQAEAAASETAA